MAITNINSLRAAFDPTTSMDPELFQPPNANDVRKRIDETCGSVFDQSNVLRNESEISHDVVNRARSDARAARQRMEELREKLEKQKPHEANNSNAVTPEQLREAQSIANAAESHFTQAADNSLMAWRRYTDALDANESCRDKVLDDFFKSYNPSR